MRLHSISLRNFKSFGDGDGAGTEMPLARISYIIGPNGAGKSNVLAGLEKIALILGGGSYTPEREDYFDNDDSRSMELGATVELSGEERMQLLSLSRNKSAAVVRGELPYKPIFRFVRHSVEYVNGQKRREKVSTTVGDNSFHALAEAYVNGDGCSIEVTSLEMVHLISMSLPEPRRDSQSQFPTTSKLVGRIDPALAASLAGLFSGLKVLDTARKIADSVDASEAEDVSADGHNLPNELVGAGRDGQAAFDKYMEPVTHGNPESIEPRMRGSRFVLETRGAGLKNRREHKDLGSGEEQSFILGWQLFKAPFTILVIKEPELHLHAERQKQMLDLIRGADPSLQFIIETHSPVFLGTAEDETVLLATKSGGQTGVARIAPENMGLIREELGISHADALYNENVLFVEGESEFRAFPLLWKTLSPGISPPPSCFSLGGAGGAKRLRPLLEYLESDGRRLFVVLDGHGDAKSHVDKLQREKLLGDNFRLLPNSFEDEFSSAQIIDAVNKAAAEAGVRAPRLTPEELDAERAGAAVAEVVKKRWFAATGSGLNKVSLARHLGGLPKGDIPPGIADALGAAAAHFKAGGGAAPAGDGSSNGGGG